MLCTELDVRAVAHSKWGDAATMDLAKRAGEESSERLRQARMERGAEKQRVAEELERQREEELSLR